MTELIELVQKHDPGSELISLFELTFNSTTLYFHPGLDESLGKVYFEDMTSPYKIREYEPFPLEMSGVEYNADGATNRPSLTIANVTDVFSDALGGLSNQDLLGSTIVVRQTLAKYLETSSTYASNTGNGALPIEFPKKKFILDRVSGESPVAVTFEVSSPYDLQGIKVPNRQIIGKYCSWVYQGYEREMGGGCTWGIDSKVDYDNGAAVLSHKAYFDKNNNPIVTAAQLTATIAAGHSGAKGYIAYVNSAAITAGTYHEHGNTVWKALLAQATTGSGQIAPQTKSIYWIRADVCAKTLTACKCRFQFVPNTPTTANSYPTTSKNTNETLPFGSFPGTKKFR